MPDGDGGDLQQYQSMRNKQLLTGLLALMALAATAQMPKTFITPKSAAAAGFDAKRLARIDSLIPVAIKAGLLPNAVTFIAHNGQIVHHKAYGYRNIEEQIPLQKNDIFRMASQTKAITSVALMTLFEEGKFLLDDPIERYIPEFAHPQVLETFNEADTTYTTRDAKRPITIRHLLTHTSGIHYGILGGGQGSMMYAKEHIPAVNSLENITCEEVVKRIAKMPLMFDPGDKYQYGMNTDVIGYLIEVLSGKKLDVFITERVLRPLGMNDTYFYLPQSEANRLVTLYSSTPKGMVVNSNPSYQTYPVNGAKTFLSGGAGLCGPIEDYARFCQMMLNHGTFNGAKILSRKTVDMMTTNHIGTLAINGKGNKFGLGFEIINHPGATGTPVSQDAYRWGGMYYTDYVIDPAENLILLFYTNVQPYRGPGIHETFRNLVYQALE